MSKVIALSILSCATLATVFLGRLMAAQESSPTGESADNASFKPVIEAPLPEGFPSYTPVGKIEVKRYPAYRKAETSGKVAFWTLFQHITTAGISMTAPVEMTFQADGPPVGREQAMAFLYGDKSIGSAGRKGNVQVVDVPAATVVCIGVRGVRSDEVLTKPREHSGIGWTKTRLVISKTDRCGSWAITARLLPANVSSSRCRFPSGNCRTRPRHDWVPTASGLDSYRSHH